MKPANNGPVYAAVLYPYLAEIVREHGYELALHGKQPRNLAVVAIPWLPTDKVSSHQTVVKSIKEKFIIREIDQFDVTHHGRIRYTLSVGSSGSLIDLSFMPVIT